ncbi:sensor histidine kinase [Flavobacterium pallidum]|uniref:sensor histidine kinase n=1 Tax=Flavobacterium pallidum TaxID=2172098 RepID=UPI0015E7FBCB|nr:ATP-binding protein [Flavobacterium pallidum]
MNTTAFGIVIAFLFVLLILAFCVLLIRLYFIKIKKYTAQLYQKDIDFQKNLNTAILETQEQVFNNISKDLHDDAGQQLTYINLQIENLKLDSEKLQQILDPLTASVNRLSVSIRDISHSLDQRLLTRQDLFQTMEHELKRLEKNPHFNLEYTISNTSGKVFSTNEKIFIFRIFQEAINNACKHSGAAKLEVRVVTSPYFEMIISDNGRGFEKTDSATSGLHNMRHRAESIGYGLDISSVLGKGTIVTLSEKNT